MTPQLPDIARRSVRCEGDDAEPRVSEAREVLRPFLEDEEGDVDSSNPVRKRDQECAR